MITIHLRERLENCATLEDAIKRILHEQQNYSRRNIIPKKNLVNITKEWRNWILERKALVGVYSLGDSPLLYIRAVYYKKTPTGDYILGACSDADFEKLDYNIMKSAFDSVGMISVNDCYLTRELVRLYRHFKGVEKKKQADYDAWCMKELKKVDAWLGEPNSLPLP